MNELARSFIGSWVVTNVHATGFKAEGDLREADALADTCARLAAAQAISRADLEGEVGPLGEHMRAALNLAQKASDVAAGRR